MTAIEVAVERACAVCGIALSGRQAKVCSIACRRHNKREYDKARYPSIRGSKAEYDAAYRLENQEKRRADASEYYWANREQKRAYDTRYREQNRESLLEQKLAWQRNKAATDPAYRARRLEYMARRRARRRDQGEFRVIDRDKRRMLARYRFCCAYCETPFGEDAPLEWDHVVPLAKGGAHSIGNLLPSCRACNRSKSARLVVEWLLTHVINDGGGWDHLRILRVR